MSSRFGLVLGIVIVALLIIIQSVFIVPETHRGLLLRFGELIKSDIEAGLHFKVPFIDDARLFDERVLLMDLPTKSYLTKEQKPLDVDSYATWRIVDLKRFYRAIGGRSAQIAAIGLLDPLVDNALRNEFGTRDMHDVVSGERDDLTSKMTSELDEIAQEQFGIQIMDVRVRAIDLPTRVSDSVYERMESERLKIAQEHRSQGEELAEGIRADADRQKIIVEAEAYREAERVRGEGDAIAAQIYADAYSRDADFYAFYRSLSAYEQTFSHKGDMLVLQPDSEFLRYFKQSLDKDGAAAIQ